MRRIFYLFVLLSIHFTSIGQENTFRFKRINSLHGLSQNDINCVFQDEKGFVWIGTNDGLNCYDGYSFEVFNADPDNTHGLRSNLIFRIQEADSRYLLIATSDKGLLIFDRVKSEFTPIWTQSDFSKYGHNVSELKVINNDLVWFYGEKGLFSFHLKDVFEKTEDEGERELNSQWRSKILHHEDIVTLRSLDVDPYNRSWFGTNYGLYCVDYSATRDHKSYNFKKVVFGDNLGAISDMVCQEGYLFLNYYKGIYRVKNSEDTNSFDTAKIEKISNLVSTNMIIDKQDRIWCANKTGITLLAQNSIGRYKTVQTLQHNSQNTWTLSTNYINSLLEDRDGVVWVGTNGGGLNLYDPKQKKFRHYQHTNAEGSLHYDKVRYLFEDSYGTLWVGTEGGGPCRMHYALSKDYTQGFISNEIEGSMGDNTVFSISEWDGEVIIGAGHSMFLSSVARFDETLKRNKMNLISNPAFVQKVDNENVLWVGTYGRGLYRFKKNNRGEIISTNWNVENSNISSNIIRSILIDRNKNIWVGTGDGLCKIKNFERKRNNPEFVVYYSDLQDEYALHNSYILPIHESKDGTIWVGTMGGGLYKVIAGSQENNDTFVRIGKEHGLPNNVIKGILEDDYGRLWISSNKGLSCYSPKTGVIRNYSDSDGLQGLEFSELSCLKRADGEMIFGGVNGFNAFYPEQIDESSREHEVNFTQLHVLNKEISVGDRIQGRTILDKSISELDEITLPYKGNSFTLFFSTLNYAAPTKTKYTYKLKGFDEEWAETIPSEHRAKYTNLSPGSYTLLVKASDDEGVFGSKVSEMEIRIIPPMYLSWYAQVLYVVLFILLLVFFQRYSIIGVRQKNNLLMEHFENEKMEELNQMKLQFFTNISHEFRTPLTLMSGPLDYLMKGDRNTSVEEKKEYLEMIKQNVKVLNGLVDQLLDFRKIEKGKMQLRVQEYQLFELSNAICSPFKVLAEKKGINYNIELPNSVSDITIDRQIIEKILFNLLSNAFKYTSSEGRIAVSFDLKDGELHIKVSDTGVGIASEHLDKLFDRFYQVENAKSTSNGGTGIGLAFAKSLSNLHKGDISVESEVGKGTTFSVSLPILAENFSEEERAQEVEVLDPTKEIEIPENIAMSEIPADEDEKYSRGRTKILIVEDNADIRMLIKKSFGKTFCLYEACDGVEGLEKVKQYNPDLIISDIMMPNMDGIEMCRRLKEDDESSHIPIILLTAKNTNEAMKEGYATGADSYISKPFALDVLTARVVALLDSRRKLRNKFKQGVDYNPSQITATKADEVFMKKLISVIEENMHNDDFKVQDLADLVHFTQTSLNNKLKALSGKTAKGFIRSIRMKRAAQLLSTGNYTVSEITYEVGFNDLKYFRQCFRKEFGMTPSDYAKVNSKVEVRDV